MLKKVALGTGALFGATFVGLYGFVQAKSSATFERPPTGLRASTDPAIIAQGEYLVHGPMHCTSCHLGTREDFDRLTAGERIVPSGGFEYAMGPVGVLHMPNLTSDPETGIAKRSDEDLARLLKYGVREDGRLSPMMAMAAPLAADEDIVAVISYLRTLPPVKKAVPPSELHFLGKALVAFGIFGPKHLPVPSYVGTSTTPSLARGEYLAKGPAHCHGCHSPYDPTDGMKLGGPLFSGCLQAERAYELDGHEVCPPNLTPHPKTGHISAWSEDQFVQRFKSHTSPKGTIMSWGNYSQLSEADLRSIFRFLRTLPPADRDVGPPIRKEGWKPGAA